jgi:hypothetical protein
MFRLALGPNYNYPALYTRFVWFVVYPIHILRQFSNLSITVLFYTVFWLYVFTVKLVILEAPFSKTLLQTVIWMTVIALPFLPFGVDYFSLAIYMAKITSYLLRVLPFLGLLTALFLANRFYFNQRYIFAGIWALVNFLLVIVVITLSDLLPIIKSQIFFHALGYRLSMVNSFVSGSPLFALLIVVFLSVFYLFIFEKQFLRLPLKSTSWTSIITPAGILIALFFVLMIMRDDFRRYRYFDYQGGIATVYFAKYDDRQILSFDDSRFTLSSSRYSVFYPFGKFNLRDTLRQHAADILRMKIIEGLDYYRLERISKIVAYGPRDEVIYALLRRVINEQTYRLPEGFRPLAEYIDRRYRAPTHDIMVSGWIVINEKPLGRTEYVVNRITVNGHRSVEPIWQDRTDERGGFHFTCYRDPELDHTYFQLIFLLPNTLIGRNADYLKVSNPVPVFSAAGNYVLDTVRVKAGHTGRGASFKEVKVTTATPADSFLLFLPLIKPGVAVRINGIVHGQGLIDTIVITSLPSLDDTLISGNIEERLRESRFYLEEMPGAVEVQMN